MREIIYSHEFDSAVDDLGGYRQIDKALESVMDGLYNNPYGFNRFENDFVSFRYAITKPFLEIPSLVVIFLINSKGDVVLEHVEEHAPY